MEQTIQNSRAFQIMPDNEKKVIRLGSYFYPFKGVLICEATDEEKKKYYCHKYMTYPIVTDGYNVRDDECITDGIEFLIMGKEGDTLPLRDIHDAADYNAVEHDCEYSMILTDLESCGITLSNRMAYDSEELLPDTITLCLDKIWCGYRMDCDSPGYYVPRRFCHISSKDNQLHQNGRDSHGEEEEDDCTLVERVSDDVWSLMWFFNRKQIRVKVKTYTEHGCGFGFGPNETCGLPEEWPEAVRNLERDINARLDELCREYPDDYNRGKRKDVPKKSE